MMKKEETGKCVRRNERGAVCTTPFFTATGMLRTNRQVRPDVGIWRTCPADKAVPETDRIWNISSGTGYWTKRM